MSAPDPAPLDPTAEQVQLRDAVRAVLARHPGHTAWDPLTAQVGAAALAVPAEYGGLGCGPAETGVVMAELGRALSPVPYLGSAVLTVGALLAAGDRRACEEHLPGLAEGSAVGALAWAEEPEGGGGRGSWEAADLRARAESDGRSGWLLTGVKRYVPAGPAEPSLVLAFARDGDTGRLGLYELTAAPAGFTVRSTMDPTRPLAELTLDRTPARLLSAHGEAVLDRVRDEACAALAAEQAGAAGRALEVTVRYAKDRRQFGRPIGSFQAVKHRLADMHTAVETSRALALAAAAAGAPPELAAAARSACSQAYAYVAGEMIQLHGGIGITWEHEAHAFFKRAHGSGQLFGAPGAHRERLAAMLGFAPPP
ncbi:acyl-CoA dehydrogenase family protein [Streptomyces sp. Isolate_45]|uniref:acyl-CoA dehydrogenase family protein n=1 Tax=Streptomyces sp. Isolate_45 TaxID=2950111 RepID=UPI002481ED94|nr:acyl-CoA dehydrogenase family protein [Streptomyces sp. Isolate_45]MDA5285784.1 acyl-CoA/acyl-ACP dehydrogenase [Streptomyces sp. Isolate_45]